MKNEAVFSTRPYWKLPLIQNRIMSYEVDTDRKLHIKSLFGKTESIPLDGLTVEVDPGRGVSWMVNRCFGSGDVILKGSAVNGTRRVENLRDVVAFQTALDGTHPDINPESIEQDWKETFDVEQLTSSVTYYPAIPKSVVKLLTEMSAPYRTTVNLQFKVKVGELVSKDDTIAVFGEHRVTAPENGRIEFLGGTTQGLHEWQFEEAEYDEKYENLVSLGSRAVQLPTDAKMDEFFLFGIRFLTSFTDTYAVPCARFAYDAGSVWIKEPAFNWFTFKYEYVQSLYSKIDLSVADFKGPRSYYLTDDLIEDDEFRRSIMPYWVFINSAAPMVVDDSDAT